MSFKTLTAGVLAATLSFTSIAPTAASAELSRDNAVVGIAALLLLGAAIHNSGDSDDRSVRTSTRNSPRGDAWRVLPAQCLTQASRRNGDHIRFFGQRCLNNTYRAVNRLPQRCHVEFRTRNDQRREGYRALCLQNQGFRTTRH